MLRLALSRATYSTRASASARSVNAVAASRWRRYNGTIAGKSNATEDVKAAQKTPADAPAKAATEPQTSKAVELEAEKVEESLEEYEEALLGGLGEPEVVTSPTFSEPSELFGTQENVDWQALGLKYDPASLPIVQELDPNVRPYTEEEYAMTLIHGRSVNPPHFHPRTHDIPVANIHFRSHHPALLSTFTHFAAHAASSLGIPTSRVIPLPTQRSLWTVLRSPFAHKKSQENFDRKVHKRAIKAWDADPEVVQRWIAYLRKHAMPGVGMKVTTWNRVPLGIGNSKVVMEAPTIHNAALESGDKIKAVAEEIVREHTKAADAAESRA
ncbi:ribosomal protein S10 domain-containing protein [Panaeolus papilionaceus]|nr:ribosomal protein S10 domain-containing protein [Panaeolus papilionaceus]